MLHRRVLCLLASNALLVSASYFSSGWTPDAASQAVPASPTPPLPSSSIAGSFPTGAAVPFDWSKLLTTGPVANLFKWAGVNVTERWDAAQNSATTKPYDTRVPMITDENYDELVKRGNPKDTWFMIVTLGDPNDLVSKQVDEIYDQAFDIALKANETPHVKWGRLDYMTVTRVTTEWMVWKAPIMVVARDQGRELRFMYASNLVMKPESIYKFLQLGRWIEVPIWTGPFAPGGSLEGVVKMYANIMTPIYTMANRIPKWLFLLASGSVASVLIQFMHGYSGDDKAKKPIAPKNPEPTTAAASNGASPASTAGRPKRFVVKKASEVNPELSASAMTSSIVSSAVMSESDGASSSPDRPKAATRRSTRKAVKK